MYGFPAKSWSSCRSLLFYASTVCRIAATDDEGDDDDVDDDGDDENDNVNMIHISFNTLISSVL